MPENARPTPSTGSPRGAGPDTATGANTGRGRPLLWRMEQPAERRHTYAPASIKLRPIRRSVCINCQSAIRAGHHSPFCNDWAARVCPGRAHDWASALDFLLLVPAAELTAGPLSGPPLCVVGVGFVGGNGGLGAGGGGWRLGGGV